MDAAAADNLLRAGDDAGARRGRGVCHGSVWAPRPALPARCADAGGRQRGRDGRVVERTRHLPGRGGLCRGQGLRRLLSAPQGMGRRQCRHRRAGLRDGGDRQGRGSVCGSAPVRAERRWLDAAGAADRDPLRSGRAVSTGRRPRPRCLGAPGRLRWPALLAFSRYPELLRRPCRPVAERGSLPRRPAAHATASLPPMRSHPGILKLLLTLSLAGGLAGVLRADDWPQWRGPQRDGVWRETGIVEKFAAAELRPVWSASIGPGYSGPTVAGDSVFLTDRVTAPEQQERVLCFERRTGRPRWVHAYPCVYRDVDYALGPRAAVTVTGGRAFSLGTMGHAHGFDAASGRVLWARDLVADYSAAVNTWGVTAAPLVAGDLVIFQIGGRPGACLVALEAQTGRERWRALEGQASYSAPRLIRHAGREVVLAWTADWL
ncbi:MAG: hypothetical protein FJ399_23930, partial [Verrucomicrobia bacterium]|nr:hypothetical protein [Verrucomicrobiota bacterium]